MANDRARGKSGFQRLWRRVGVPLALLALVGCAGSVPQTEGDKSADAGPALSVDAPFDGLGAALYRVGINALDAGAADTALRFFEESLEEAPGAIPPSIGRADALVALGRGRDAAAIYRQVVKADPSDTEVRGKLVNILIKSKNYSEAVPQLKILIKARETAQLHNMLAAALAGTGDAEGARRQYLLALKLDPDNMAALTAIARADRAAKTRVSSIASPVSSESLPAPEPARIPVSAPAQAAIPAPKPETAAELPTPEHSGAPPQAAASEQGTEPPAAPSPAAAAAQPMYRVQLAAYRNLSRMHRGQALIAKKAGDLLPEIVEEHRGSEPGLLPYRLATPAVAGPAARSLCASLKRRGLGCLVVRRAGKSPDRVQLAAFRSLDRVNAYREQLRRAVGNRLPGLEVLVRKSARPDRAFFHLRTRPLGSAETAKALCRDLRSRGLECFAVRQNDGLWRSAG